MKPDQRVFVGVVAPIDPHVETREQVRDRVLEAAEYIPLEQLGTTDDCGFSPFSDDQARGSARPRRTPSWRNTSRGFANARVTTVSNTS